MKVVSRSAKELEVNIEGEDVSLAQIVHHELLKDKDVVFSGVHPPHPLLKILIIRIQTAKGDPKDALVSSGKAAAENAKILLEEMDKSLEQR